MVAILSENKYADSLWCKKIRSALVERLREKRIPFCEIYDLCPAEADTLFVIGSDPAWLTDTIRSLNAAGRCPIVLCGQSEPLPGCLYNCVCTDVDAAMHSLLLTLADRGKKSVALYGVNPSSLSDVGRKDALLHFGEGLMERITPFFNEGSLDGCFESFYPQIEGYDAIVCANDFAAVSLVKGLRERGDTKRRSIISCTSSALSDRYGDVISSLKLNYRQYGKAAVFVYETLQKTDYISGLTVKVPWEAEPTQTHPSESVALGERVSDDAFYDDPTLAEMLVVDKLLTLSDPTDLVLLDSLAKSMTLEEIAAACFLSVSAVKYRIKNLVRVSGADHRHRMIALYSKYLP